MKGYIWDLPPQEINTPTGVSTIEVGAWEIATEKYILLSKDLLMTSQNEIQMIPGTSFLWYPTHLYHQGLIPSKSVVDHTEPTVVDSYITSPMGIQAILMGLSRYFPYSPHQLLKLFHAWMNNEDTTESV